ncbi:MAG: glycosyltransferase [Planctomycetes bacterium]|nr:glycosyltransferase [Planctomycetota bacterium]
MKLSILVPVFNERYLVGESLRRVLAAPLPENMSREVVVVDDGSTDGSREVVEEIARQHPDVVKAIRHDRNRGKGAAVRSAVAAATGDFCVIQDADLEYDPRDYGRLLAPFLGGQADVVYGSRFAAAERRRVLYFWHSVGNRALTTLSNVATNLNLTDVLTCYKAFRTEVLRSIPIRSNGFGIELELTAKIAKRGMRVFEVPVNYDGRTYPEGKKARWYHGFAAVWAILKYWLIDDLYDQKTGHDILASISRAQHFNAWMARRVVRPWLGDRVLEIGAGIGNLTVHLLPRERYIASEPDGLHLDVLKSLSLRRTSLEAIRIDAQRAEDFAPIRRCVDTVVCLNVLEHIPDAAAALRNMHDVLAPGGRAIILVPQGQWLYGPMDRALDHQKRYSREDLRRAMTEAGFVVERTFDFNRVGVLGWALNSRLLGRTKMPKFQLKAFDALVWLWKIVDGLLPWHGLSIVAVGRKALEVPGTPAAAPPPAEAAPAPPSADSRQ